MDRNLALEFVRVTEAAAIASARLMGRGDERAADEAAVQAMRRWLNSISMAGEVVIGEGERDEAPMLYIGEKVGCGDHPKVDIALDPLEGTTITALGGANALSVIAVATQGNFLHAPDTYMDKIAVGPRAKGAIDIRKSVRENLQSVADKLGRRTDEVTAIILDRPRHIELIKEARSTGARIKLIRDGDVSAAIATCREDTGIDVLLGIGGAPEGVIAAAALRCVGGDMQGVLKFRNAEERERGRKMGISDADRAYSIEDLAAGDVMFAATGVTTGDFLDGVRFYSGGAATHSVVMRSRTKTVRYIKASHHFEFKPEF
jgi:fructose-1,6-bisphosphatase II